MPVKWVILTDLDDTPCLVLDADSYLRAVLADSDTVDAYEHCHRPIVIEDPEQASAPIAAITRRAPTIPLIPMDSFKNSTDMRRMNGR